MSFLQMDCDGFVTLRLKPLPLETSLRGNLPFPSVAFFFSASREVALAEGVEHPILRCPCLMGFWEGEDFRREAV